MTERLRIAVDFDGVLFDHVPYVLRGFRDHFGIDLEREGLRYWDYNHYRAVRDRELSRDQVQRLLWAIETDPHVHDVGLRDPRAARVIRRWRREGHRVEVVTARHPRSEAVTTGFLRRNRIGHDGLRMAVRLKTGYDVLLDDAPHNVLAAASDGTLALLMDQPYNRDVPSNGNPQRVHRWLDAARAVDKHLSKTALLPPATDTKR